MMRSSRLRIILAGCLLAFTAVFGGQLHAFTLFPIPEGVDAVAVVHNHSGIALEDFILKNPFVGKMELENYQNFLKATSMNPLRDISAFQAMVKFTEPQPEALLAISGQFDSEKITATMKLMGQEKVTEEKVGDMTVLVVKGGNVGFCFLEKSLAIGGSMGLLKGFIEARKTSASDPDFAPLVSQFNEKAYFTVMAAGPGLFEKIKKEPRHPTKPIELWMREYLIGDFSPKTVFGNLLDDKLEFVMTYDRAEAKDLKIHFLIEHSDAKLRIQTILAELLKALPDLKKKAAPSSTDG